MVAMFDFKSFRASLGLTQTEMACQLGIRQGAVCNYETGIRNVSIPVAKKIRKKYGVPLSDIRPDVFEAAA